jgi:hypothetical protein
MKHKYSNGDTIEFDSDYSIGDLVKYQKISKAYHSNTTRTEYSRIMFVTATIDGNNKLLLKYKMENGKMVSHSEILGIEKKFKPER